MNEINLCKICSTPLTGHHTVLCGARECRNAERRIAYNIKRDKLIKQGKLKPVGHPDNCTICGKAYMKKSSNQKLCGSSDCAKKNIDRNQRLKAGVIVDPELERVTELIRSIPVCSIPATERIPFRG